MLLDGLPIEILYEIFKGVSPRDLIQLILINARLRAIITGNKSPVRNRLPSVRFKLQIKEYYGVKGYTKALDQCHEPFYFNCYELVLTGQKKDEIQRPMGSLFLSQPCCDNNAYHRMPISPEEDRLDYQKHPSIDLNALFREFFTRRNNDFKMTFKSKEEVKYYVKSFLVYLYMVAEISKVTLSELKASSWKFLEPLFMDLHIGQYCPVECHLTDGQNSEDDLMIHIDSTQVPISYFYITSSYCFPPDWFFMNGLQNAHIHFVSYGDVGRLIVTFRALSMLITKLYTSDTKLRKWEICSNRVGFPQANFLSHLMADIEPANLIFQLNDDEPDDDSIEEVAIVRTPTQELEIAYSVERRIGPSCFNLSIESL